MGFFEVVDNKIEIDYRERLKFILDAGLSEEVGKGEVYSFPVYCKPAEVDIVKLILESQCS